MCFYLKSKNLIYKLYPDLKHASVISLNIYIQNLVLFTSIYSGLFLPKTQNIYFFSIKHPRPYFSQTCLDERVDVKHQRLSPADDELVDTGDGVRPGTQTKQQLLRDPFFLFPCLQLCSALCADTSVKE